MSRLGRVGLGIVVLAGALLSVVIAAFVVGGSFDVSHWRDAAAQKASAALGRPVMLQGALQLTLGREPMLRIGSVRVPNTPGFSNPDLLFIGETRVRIDLFDALRGVLRLRRVEGEDIELWLQRDAEGRGNWRPSQGRAPGDPLASKLPDIDIGQIALKRLDIHYNDARTAKRRDFALASAFGSFRKNQALQLSLRGPVDADPAVRLELEGAPLRLLQDVAAPWPFKLDFKAPGASLQAGGLLDVSKGEARFDFNAAVDDLPRAGQWLNVTLPQVGRAALLGRATATAEGIDLDIGQGTLAGADVSGQLALAFAGPRQRLNGALQIGTLDLRPWRNAQAGAPDVPIGREAAAWRALALRDLVPLDADLELRVDRWLGLPVDLRDVSLMLHADARGMRAPWRATLSGSKVLGEMHMDTAVPTPTLVFELAATDLARDAWGVEGIEATLGRVGMRLAGRGETIDECLKDLEASVSVSALKARYTGGQGAAPLALELDNLELLARRGERLVGSARGSLLGERVSVSLRGGRLPEMLDAGALPIELELATGSATLRIATDLAGLATAPDPTLSFQLKARRSGDLARWLGVAAQSTLPVAVHGRLRLPDDAWQLTATTLKLGRSEMVIDAKGTRADGGGVDQLTVRATLLDVPELSSLRAAAAPRRRGAAPVLPTGIERADVDLQIDLDHVRLGRTDLEEVGLVAQIRQGHLLSSALRGRVAGTALSGLVELDLRDAWPRARIDLSASDVDVGGLLRELGVAEGLDGRADALQFSMQAQGATLREFAAHAAVEARLLGGSISVGGAKRRLAADIRVREAVIGAAAGEPLRARLTGLLDSTPVQIELSSGTLSDVARDAEHLPFAMSMRAAGALLTLDGEVALPLGREGMLRFALSGERLDSLSELARVELPAWGPWSFGGPIRMTPTGYELQGLQVGVGRSRLSGSGKLDLSGPRPHLALQVSAPSIQVDDFPLPQRMTEAPERSERRDGLRGTATELADRTDRLLGARFLRRFDADIDVRAKEVLAGVDRLADGEIHLKLRDGRLDLDPAVVNLPGGSMRLSLTYDLKESELDFAVAAYIERFDYGIIARRLGRADDLRGLFSMTLEMQGRAPSLDTIMRNANGRLDVAVWPTELRSGVFNLWSVNLVLKLLPLIEPDGQSQVNCIVGRFDLKGGIVSDDKIIIDTTALRIRGAGQANLATEQLSFVFRPRAKGVALFRLQTPLRVTGTLYDQRFGFAPGDTAESVLRLIASPILLPIERLVLGPLPRNGADICTDPLRALGP